MEGTSATAAGLPYVLRRAPGSDRRGAIVYAHGGGLVYGSMRDYPECSARRFLDEGFDVLSIGYPLAPETGLAAVIESTAAGLIALMDEGVIDGEAYYAFGRSAGTFLWVALINRLKQARRSLPRAFLAFYGYASLRRLRLFKPDGCYRADYPISQDVALGLVRADPVFDDPAMERLLLYVFARQQGMVGTLLDVSPDQLDAYDFESGSECELPPTFATWCSFDDEVDPAASRALCALSPDCAMWVVDAYGHDYDQMVDTPEYGELMRRLFAWLKER